MYVFHFDFFLNFIFDNINNKFKKSYVMNKIIVGFDCLFKLILMLNQKNFQILKIDARNIIFFKHYPVVVHVSCTKYVY